MFLTESPTKEMITKSHVQAVTDQTLMNTIVLTGKCFW